ncbi:pimeloyl-ACP methyl ester carboxylesterase [Crossiella equi]|uniref:Pimeloyl-ACP methyl ester carboxylesterase n=1 Tax=Crossiella equi TaxID=130796 RepID=A0ABS5A4Q3_9PSEU|nr:alpha/beta hydrolase [Crossiella equi]MBP2471558.1 pimeloyl-ACP methyl ester carboxylesterase [Crossiella equi]
MHTHATAPTQLADAGGVQLAYRRFGAETGTPLVFLQHFRGGLDHWDPAVTDGLARTRPVVLVNYGGVGASTGQTPDTVEGMADQVAAALRSLGLTEVDVLGFSIGGMVAQELTLRNPGLVRRLVLVGTKPKGGTTEGAHPDFAHVATRNEVPVLEDFQFLFFDPSETSQQAGREFWARRNARTEGRDPNSGVQTMQAQGNAVAVWQAEDLSDLEKITQPVLVVNGREDIMVPTYNSYLLARHLPNAQLSIYPDAGHGSLFQYPELFVSQTTEFLDR